MVQDQSNPPQDEHVEQQAQQQTGKRVQLRVDEHQMQTTYANAFRANGTAEEVMMDFGLNIPNPVQRDTPEIIFQVTNRVIMNYYSAKRLALTLTQVIRRHEEQFGELEMDVSKRRRSDS